MYSAYLDKELDIPFENVTANSEETIIIPHAALENIIYNSQETAIRGITVHHVCLVSEPRHYAFLCSIEDSEGRRVEGVGEALDATLDTQISLNYPVLMAFKRAFDDAAIKFLRLPGKVYTDQQIRLESEPSDPSATYSAPPLDDTPPENAPRSENGKKAPAAKGNIPSRDSSGSAYSAPPLDGGPSAPEEKAPTPTKGKKTTETFGAPPLDDDVSGKSSAQASSFSAPPLDADDGANDDENEDGDEFDTTLIRYGKFKNMGYSIREAYAADPSSVHWVAEEMYATGAAGEEEQRDICARYIALMEGGVSQ